VKEHLARRKPVGWAARSYRPGDERQILSLYPLAFQGLQRSEEYWRWKFRENPVCPVVIVAEESGGRIIGLIAGLSARVHADGRGLVFSQAVDVMVDPGARRGLRKAGMYITLIRALIEGATGKGDALLFGLPNQDSDRVSQEVFGWQNLHQVIRVVRPLNGAGGPAVPWRLRLRYRIRPLEECVAAADRLWELCRPAVPLGTIRDAQYLRWRYLRCPHLQYRGCLVWDRRRDAPAGLAVLRLGWEGQPVGAIVDWLVPRGEPGVGLLLLRHAERQARRAGLRELSAWFPPESPEQQWFLGQGYRGEPTRYPLVAKSYRDDLPLGWVSRHWYYTMGDSDIF
jgi:hypothetical protein